MNYTTFWQGWEAALEALEFRAQTLQTEVNSHTKPHDVVLDLLNEIKELRATGGLTSIVQ